MASAEYTQLLPNAAPRAPEVPAQPEWVDLRACIAQVANTVVANEQLLHMHFSNDYAAETQAAKAASVGPPGTLACARRFLMGQQKLTAQSAALPHAAADTPPRKQRIVNDAASATRKWDPCPTQNGNKACAMRHH